MAFAFQAPHSNAFPLLWSARVKNLRKPSTPQLPPPTEKVSIEIRILAAAPEHAQLQERLAKSKWALLRVHERDDLINTITNNLKDQRISVEAFHSESKRSLKRYMSYRDSTVKRVVYRIAGQSHLFNLEKDLRKRESHEAMLEYHHAKEEETAMHFHLHMAEVHRSLLRFVVSCNRRAQVELDALYEWICRGPWADFPEENKKHDKVDQAIASHKALEKQRKAELQALHLLGSAQRTMQCAIESILQARDAFDRADDADEALQGPTISTDIDNAKDKLGVVFHWVALAHRKSALVQHLPASPVASGTAIGSRTLESTLEETMGKVSRHSIALEHEVKRCRGRLSDMREQMAEADKRITSARVELQKAREKVFEMVVGAGEKR